MTRPPQDSRDGARIAARREGTPRAGPRLLPAVLAALLLAAGPPVSHGASADASALDLRLRAAMTKHLDALLAADGSVVPLKGKGGDGGEALAFERMFEVTGDRRYHAAAVELAGRVLRDMRATRFGVLPIKEKETPDGRTILGGGPPALGFYSAGAAYVLHRAGGRGEDLKYLGRVIDAFPWNEDGWWSADIDVATGESKVSLDKPSPVNKNAAMAMAAGLLAEVLDETDPGLAARLKRKADACIYDRILPAQLPDGFWHYGLAGSDPNDKDILGYFMLTTQVLMELQQFNPAYREPRLNGALRRAQTFARRSLAPMTDPNTGPACAAHSTPSTPGHYDLARQPKHGFQLGMILIGGGFPAEGTAIMDAALRHFPFGHRGMDGVHAAAPSAAVLRMTPVRVAPAARRADVLVEAEAFADTGGWTVDQQSMDTMGSPYLLAHGLGVPVADAATTVGFPEAGTYRVWVRTRDWTASWKTPDTPPTMRAEGTPGVFRLSVDGQQLPATFGTAGADWHWQDGGLVTIGSTRVALALRDLTGFAGRCDAILFRAGDAPAPPDGGPELDRLRRALSGHPEEPADAGTYDLVVVGGGMAGCCAAVSAARLGCRVALIQDRPVLGGNNSSEVRVGLSGLIHQAPYPRLGDLVDEIGPVGHWNLWEAKREPDAPRSRRILEIVAAHPEKKTHNAGPASNYEDQRKIDVVRAETNVTLVLNAHVNGVAKDGARIVSVVAQDIRTGGRRRYSGRVFADCTGDGSLGVLAGADFREGRESRAETGEALAPESGDRLVMGTSVQWYADEEPAASAFPDCPWAVRFDADTCIPADRGDWDWETGAMRDQVAEIERIRDYALRVVYGNWAVLKNDPRFRDRFAGQRLAWVACIGGKRESRRLMGDVVLAQQDIVGRREFPDACVTTTWTIDLHYPKVPACACEAFQSEARHLKIEPYPIPYRCLYSRNVDNLLMAGRDISVTHVALGTVRVMRTGGMMGEVVGMAASLCTRRGATPRGVYERHLGELKALMTRGVGREGAP